jgi:hypothetical protein
MNRYASYYLPSIYIGASKEAEELRALVREIPALNPDQFKSQNEFLLYCIRYTINQAPIKKPAPLADLP